MQKHKKWHKRTSAYLPVDEYEALKRVLERAEISFSEFVRQAIKRELKAMKMDISQFELDAAAGDIKYDGEESEPMVYTILLQKR